jgi:hypothetical protein
MRRLLLGAGLAGASLLGVLALLERPPSPAAVPGGPSGAVVAPPAVADATGHAARPAPERRLPSPPPAGAGDAAAEEPDARERDRAARAAFERGLDDHLAAEAADSTWATATEARIVEAVRTGFAGTRVRAAVCKASLCRVELDHDDDEAQERFLARVTFTAPFDGRGYIRRSRPGEPHTTRVYLARNGQPLPGTGTAASR